MGCSSAPTPTSAVPAPIPYRSWDCPTPPYVGIEGQVKALVTFAPSGSYVSHEIRSVTYPEGAIVFDDEANVASVNETVPECSAEPLSSQYPQVNQSVEATFEFRDRP